MIRAFSTPRSQQPQVAVHSPGITYNAGISLVTVNGAFVGSVPSVKEASRLGLLSTSAVTVFSSQFGVIKRSDDAASPWTITAVMRRGLAGEIASVTARSLDYGWRVSFSAFDAVSLLLSISSMWRGEFASAQVPWGPGETKSFSLSCVWQTGITYEIKLAFNGVIYTSQLQGDPLDVVDRLQIVGGVGLYNLRQTISSAEQLLANARNPWHLFSPIQRQLLVGAIVSLPVLGYAVSDTFAGAWTPSTGATLYGMINEAIPNDADYISVISLSTCEVALNETALLGGAGQTLSYRASSTGGSGITVTLRQGVTIIASWSHALTLVDTLYVQTLTAPQIAAISAGALSVQLTST